MPQEEGVTVRGLDDLARALGTFPAAVERDQKAPAQRAADATGRRVASVVPRRSGALAGSVDASGGSVSMGDGLAYGGWIEYGGSRGRPYVPQGRFVLPSALEAQDAYVRDATTETQATIRRHAWPKAPL